MSSNSDSTMYAEITYLDSGDVDFYSLYSTFGLFCLISPLIEKKNYITSKTA